MKLGFGFEVKNFWWTKIP